MDPFITVPVHFYTFISINCSDLPVNISTCPQMYYKLISIPVQFIAQWPFNSSIGVPTNKINLPVYLHASLSSNHKDIPVTTTTYVHAHRCTHSGPYVFIFILSFWLTVKIYPSTVLLFYMSTDIPVHQYTPFDLISSFFGITCTITLQLIYWDTYPQIDMEINLSIYPHAFHSSNH